MSVKVNEIYPDPRVLVVIPTLGQRLETLSYALTSVANQRSVQARVALVLPGTAQDARELGRKFGATLVDDPGRGLSAALNAGVASQRSEEFFAWLNDDDFLMPDGLARLAAALERRPDAVVAYGACIYVDGAGHRLGVSRAGSWAARILPWGPDLVPMPSSLTRMKPLLEVGSYDEELSYAMDLDMLLRLRQEGPFVALSDEVAAFRWHADSLTVANRHHSLAESKLVKHRYLSRRARRLAPVWDGAVDLATHVAVRLVNRRARAVSKGRSLARV